jgi:hypothetical protein
MTLHCHSGYREELHARITHEQGRVIAQEGSHWLLTAEARVTTCGICGRQSGTGAGFLRVLRFPLPIIPPTASHSLSIIRAGTIGQRVSSVILDSIPLQRKMEKNCEDRFLVSNYM